jgi:hypothetical protein
VGCSQVSYCSLQQSGRYISQPNQIRILNYSRRAKKQHGATTVETPIIKREASNTEGHQKGWKHDAVFRNRKFVSFPVPGSVIIGTTVRPRIRIIQLRSTKIEKHEEKNKHRSGFYWFVPRFSSVLYNRAEGTHLNLIRFASSITAGEQKNSMEPQ